MFQSFANFLLGSVIDQNQGATAEGVENSSIRLTSVESDNGWVLVDRDSEGNSDTSSVDSFDGREEEENAKLPLPAISRTSSSSSLHYLASMDDSWFVTPPPCFTSAGPIHMETSPLENLLIEHPSMSVYQNSCPHRRHKCPVRAVSPEPVRDEEEVIEQVAVVRRAPRRNHLHVMQQSERQVVRSRHTQKVHIQKACELLKRGHLDRKNKAREVSSRNQRQRRGQRSQGATRSCANNNRKC